MRTYMWKKLEIALLLALAATLLWGADSLHRQETLSRKMIRLHVIANSDSDADHPLAFVVFVENGGGGASAAGPIASALLQAATAEKAEENS